MYYAAREMNKFLGAKDRQIRVYAFMASYITAVTYAHKYDKYLEHQLFFLPAKLSCFLIFKSANCFFSQSKLYVNEI